MIEYFLPLFAVAALACLASARAGIWISIGFGFAMDPVRKLAPDQPVWMTGVVAGLVAATWAGIRLRGEASPLAGTSARARALVWPLAVGAAWIVIEAVRGFERTGSPAVVVIGVLAYTLPVLALFVGYAALDRGGDLERLATVYVAGATVMLAAAVAARLGLRHAILDQVGLGLRVHAAGRTIPVQGGLFRGLEMAGWHAAAALGLVIVLAMTARRRPWLALVLPCAATLGWALMLTARRKYVVQLLLFLALWTAIGWLYRRSRQAGAWAAVGILAAGVVVASIAPGSGPVDRTTLDPTLRRLEELNEGGGRISYLAGTALSDVYAQNGFLGSGAGTASQGAQYFGAGANRFVGYAAEGGFGKVLGELGIPGLLLLAWLGVALARATFSAVGRADVRRADATDLSGGVVALLASNVAVFAIAHQVYGDPFVLTMLGLLGGGLLRASEPTADDPDAVSEESGA